MNERRPFVLFSCLLLVAAAGMLGWWYWPRVSDLDRVEELKAEMLAPEHQELSEQQREKKVGSMMRMVDNLGREDQTQMMKELEEQRREIMLASARKWKDMPEEERGEFIDAEVKRYRHLRKVGEAMRPDVPRVRERFRKSYYEEQEANASQEEGGEAEVKRDRWGREIRSALITEEERAERRRNWKPPERGSRRGRFDWRNMTDEQRAEMRRRWEERRKRQSAEREEWRKKNPDEALLRDYWGAIGRHYRSKQSGQRD